LSKAFITYLFGGYDYLEKPNVVTPGWDYICVSDQSVDTAGWRTIQPPSSILLATSCPKRRSALVKIFHYEAISEDYDLVVCGDACLTINWRMVTGCMEKATAARLASTSDRR